MNEKIMKILCELEDENQIFFDDIFFKTKNELYICIKDVLSVDKTNKKIKQKTSYPSKVDELVTLLFLNLKAVVKENRYTFLTLKNGLKIIMTYQSLDYKDYDRE